MRDRVNLEVYFSIEGHFILEAASFVKLADSGPVLAVGAVKMTR